MHEITITRRFNASHAIKLYDGSLEPVNEHDWIVEATVGCEHLDRIGLVMDFHRLERYVESLIEGFEGRMLNEVPPFADESGRLELNPTAEQVAAWIGRQLSSRLRSGARVVSVRVTEAPDCRATWRP